MKLPSVMLDKWFWITLLSVIFVVVVPLTVIWLVLQVPPMWRLAATITIFVMWAVVSGYKDWVISKSREFEEEPLEA